MKRLKAQVRVEVIRKLECYQPTTTYDDGEITVMKAHDGPEFWAKKSSSLFNDFSYHYPVVLDPDGTWQTGKSERHCFCWDAFVEMLFEAGVKPPV